MARTVVWAREEELPGPGPTTTVALRADTAAEPGSVAPSSGAERAVHAALDAMELRVLATGP